MAVVLEIASSAGVMNRQGAWGERQPTGAKRHCNACVLLSTFSASTSNFAAIFWWPGRALPQTVRRLFFKRRGATRLTASIPRPRFYPALVRAWVARSRSHNLHGLAAAWAAQWRPRLDPRRVRHHHHHERPDSTDSQRPQAPASRPAADWLVLSRTVDPEMRICHSHRLY